MMRSTDFLAFSHKRPTHSNEDDLFSTYVSVDHVAHDLGVSLTWNACSLSAFPYEVSMCGSTCS